MRGVISAVTYTVDVTRDWLDYLTVVGTVGAASVAALAVRQTGKQARAQQSQWIAARIEDRLERRAEFELGVLLELGPLVQVMARYQNLGGPNADYEKARALLHALPVDAVPHLNAFFEIRSTPTSDAAVAALVGNPDFFRVLQSLVDNDLAEAIASRHDMPRTADVEARPGRRWWRRLLRRT